MSLGRLVGVLEEDRRQGRRVDAVDARGRGGQAVDEVRNDDRRLVEQQRLDLAGERLLRLQVDGRDVLLDQRVVLRVLEVGRIPRLMRSVMLLRDIQGLPMRDVARELGITVSAAKSRLVRARAELRNRMTKHYHGASNSSALSRNAAPLIRVGKHCSMHAAA